MYKLLHITIDKRNKICYNSHTQIRRYDKASDDGEVVIVTRKEEKNVVILSMEQYNQLQKQVANAKYLSMLDKSMQQIQDGGIVIKDIKDFED